MPRVKRGTTSLKRRRKILRRAKGFRFGRSKKERAAREALLHAGAYALAHRRDKKGDFRRLWQIKINAAVRLASPQGGPLGLSYSRFINLLKQNKIELDRKILADLAEHEPAVFAKIVEAVKT
ncbi:MAG: 50S ribosomal protein L20 [Candidatus Vogelbacteria bacterium]|nr:50S ribosomal protein L20 [Candidatus Vogelbacteria bacterium]